jgi:hypothetical protein
VGDDSHFVFHQKLLGENGSVRQAIVMVKQPGLLSPKFGVTSSHVFTHSPQNVTVEPGIHSLACWDRCFALPQLLHRWRHQSGIFWIQPCTCLEDIGGSRGLASVIRDLVTYTEWSGQSHVHGETNPGICRIGHWVGLTLGTGK